MRSIEFKKNVNGLTKIFVAGKELTTALDATALNAFRLNKKKLPPIAGEQILNAISKKLAGDHVTLAADETKFILHHVKDLIGA